MKTFNVLPTDSRFTDLTEEQRSMIWEHYLIDNPEIAKKLNNQFNDPEFDKEWDSLSEDSQEASEGVSSNFEGKDEEDEIEANYEEFISSSTADLSLPDYKEVLKAKGIVLDNENVGVDIDWEEVD